jgi:hypothetical protein
VRQLVSQLSLSCFVVVIDAIIVLTGRSPFAVTHIYDAINAISEQTYKTSFIQAEPNNATCVGE